jgi:molecular chaperone DnaK (HSP70)
VDVDDAAVQQMVEESVEHAFEDLAARRWIEVKLKANELAIATRKGVADCAGELEPEYVARIEMALNEIQSALMTEQPATGSGDLKHLKSASAALDEATKPLADLLMDKAMEAMLRKRGVIS